MDRPKTPIDEQVAAAEREVRQRLYVYPRRVAAGRMTQAQADRETRAMEDIVETLKGIQAQGRLL